MGFNTKKIRVMIVDDSMLARRIIQNGLSRYPNIEVVGGVQRNGRPQKPLSSIRML